MNGKKKLNVTKLNEGNFVEDTGVIDSGVVHTKRTKRNSSNTSKTSVVNRFTSYTGKVHFSLLLWEEMVNRIRGLTILIKISVILQLAPK